MKYIMELLSMNFSVNLYDIISWFLTVVSTILYIVERRRNDHTKHYMTLQGILRECDKWSGYYANTHFMIDKQQPQRRFSREEYLELLRIAHTNLSAMREPILGAMMGLEISKERKFSAEQFVRDPQFMPAVQPAPQPERPTDN